MNFLRSFWRTVKPAFLALALAFWAVGRGFAAAAEDEPAKSGSGGAGDYTLAYFLLIMGVVLGLLIVLRSSNRRERESPEAYVSKNIMQQE